MSLQALGAGQLHFLEKNAADLTQVQCLAHSQPCRLKFLRGPWIT